MESACSIFEPCTGNEKMRTRNLSGFFMIAGLLILSCRLTQPEATSVISTKVQITQLPPPPEITTTAEKRFPATPTSFPKSIFEVRQSFPLQIPRTRHTATLLSNGEILLVGGSLEPDDFVADEELFDPLTGLSSWTKPLHTMRHGHTATLLMDGRVLVVGGYSLPQQWLSDAEVYDPTGDTWTVVPPLHSHATGHTATLMKDGRVLVVGGCIGSGICTEKVEIFDPHTNHWIEAQPLKSDRASHTAQLLTDGRVLIAGGTGAAGGSPVDGEGAVYDPQTNTWTRTGPMVSPRHSPQSVRLPNGQVLVAGGFPLDDPSNQKMTTSTEIYDPVSNTWKPAADLTEARYTFILISLPNGQVLAIGGAHSWEGWWNADSFVGEIEVYDPVIDRWQIVGELPQPGAYATGILLPNRRVWVAGGQYGDSGSTFPPETWLIISPKP
jgi:Kelch motif protein/galactose oxidase-like protein